MKKLTIRPYTPKDYPAVKALYDASGWFDPETDAEARLNVKSKRDPASLLVATNPDVIGTLSLIEDGRIAIFFRLVTEQTDDAQALRKQLLQEGETIFKKRGYKEAHIIAPEEDSIRQTEYASLGFIKGNEYRWMWKKLKT